MVPKLQISSNGEGQRGKVKIITIVGGGLVGSLAALHVAKKGYEVHLYEYREDIRKSQLAVGRSINLALSARGRKALREVGLEDKLLEHGIPMRGRMLHDLKGHQTFVPYDPATNQCIYSVSRKYLNEILLTEAETYSNIRLYFNKKLTKASLGDGELDFMDQQTKTLEKVQSDLVIGCDGAFSTVRKNMLQEQHGFDFSQEYIEHGYIELCIPAKDNDFAMPSNYLHIWPRGKFMMIALPNQDKSWTVTLFMSFDSFDKIKSKNDLLDFFEEHFADSIPLIGEERLLQDFFKATPQHLVSIKCRPYHLNGSCLLMGDAAHAMVPFFGQGMNAGFEDCSILSSILEKYDQDDVDFGKVLQKFSDLRWEDAHSICDLAMYNYVEMRDLVTRLSFRTRKCMDDFLFMLLPSKWMPLYNSVSFSHMPYKMCVANRKFQDHIVNCTIMLASLATIGSALFVGQKAFAQNFAI